MGARVICISRALAARAEDIATLVASGLGFRYVDEEIIARAAEKQNLAPSDVADVEQRKSLLSRLLEGIGDARAGEAVTFTSNPSAMPMKTEALRALIREAIVETAAQGQVVIVAHAASYAIGRRTDALRVLITGSAAARTQRLASSPGHSESDAPRLIRESDAARLDYLKRFYAVERELPEHYDLCISTDMLHVRQAAQLIIQAAREIEA